MARIRITEPAHEEFEKDHGWYLARDLKAAEGFRQHVHAALQRIAESPESFPFCHAEYRQLILTRYPHYIVYRIEGDEAVVVAIAHAKRRPGYWRSRIR